MNRLSSPPVCAWLILLFLNRGYFKVFFCWHKIVKKQWRTHLCSTYKLAFLRIKNLMKFNMQKTRRFKFECLIKIFIPVWVGKKKKNLFPRKIPHLFWESGSGKACFPLSLLWICYVCIQLSTGLSNWYISDVFERLLPANEGEKIDEELFNHGTSGDRISPGTWNIPSALICGLIGCFQNIQNGKRWL